MAVKDLRINKMIRVPEIRLIDENGEQKGIIKTYQALALADEAGLDLVEVSPNAQPPVCKILNYGKYRFELEKKLRDAKKNQTVVEIKEIRMQPKIDKGDLETKTKFISKFLLEGNKVKVSIRFRGRELAHTYLGKEVLDRILALLEEREVFYNVDKNAAMEGKMMTMLLSPAKVKK